MVSVKTIGRKIDFFPRITWKNSFEFHFYLFCWSQKNLKTSHHLESFSSWRSVSNVSRIAENLLNFNWSACFKEKNSDEENDGLDINEEGEEEEEDDEEEDATLDGESNSDENSSPSDYEGFLNKLNLKNQFFLFINCSDDVNEFLPFDEPLMFRRDRQDRSNQFAMNWAVRNQRHGREYSRKYRNLLRFLNVFAKNRLDLRFKKNRF